MVSVCVLSTLTPHSLTHIDSHSLTHTHIDSHSLAHSLSHYRTGQITPVTRGICIDIWIYRYIWWLLGRRGDWDLPVELEKEIPFGKKGNNSGFLFVEKTILITFGSCQIFFGIFATYRILKSKSFAQKRM